ncbi:MAG: 4Fe-4S binding protein [Sterolibacterium sp.]|nr:4Fe-4S binding protein [Sterolibacterium sp.]
MRGGLARLGEAMLRHRRAIQAVQWTVVLFYMALVIIPAFQPIPPEGAHLWNNLRLFAQFMFWGVWWPGVMLATLLFGRVWCGIFCPEGTLTEWASNHGLGRPVPHWLKWSGWPFFAFICTTIYGQLISVYEYPQAALLILGGSSLAALAIGFIYGRGKRIWCRHLCPASGVFALLARVAPLHFRVDRAAWDHHTPAAARPIHIVKSPAAPVNCAPLIDIRRMTGASECHACGRCAGHRGAVALAARAPWQEILSTQTRASTSEALTLIFGVLGVASAAFQWTISPWFVRIKLAIAEKLVEGEHFLLLGDEAPWWVLTHYPEANDVFTWLDGLLVTGYIVGIGLLIGSLVWLSLALAARCLKSATTPLNWQRLSLALVPLAGISIFVGLSMLTSSQLKSEGIVLNSLPALRAALIGSGMLVSAVLGVRLIMQNGSAWPRRLAAAVFFLLSLAVMGGNWYQVLFAW